MSRFSNDDEVIRRAIAEGRTLGGMLSPDGAALHAKALEWARARAADPTPDPDNSPKWWGYDGSDEAPKDTP